MAVGDIEYCSIAAMLRMGEEDKDDGVNPVVTEVTSKWGSDDQKKFTMTANGKAFHLTVNETGKYTNRFG